MRSNRFKLLSTTVIPAVVGAGFAAGGAMLTSSPTIAASPPTTLGAPLPVAKPKPRMIELAACNPCSAKKKCNPCNPCAAKKKCNPCNPCAAKKACNPCNPCAAKKKCNPCNPCAAKKCNPCNPCAAKACNPCNPCNPCGAGGAVSNKCVVPSLAAAWKCNPCNPCNPCAAKKKCNPCNPCAAKKKCNPCNPCAAKKACNPCNPCAAKKKCNPCNPCAAKKKCNPCNPCAAKKACNPCNPCAAKKKCNPCNPCAAKNPCNPCGACNPCNPCGAGGSAEISAADAKAVYNCLKGEMRSAYAKAGVGQVAGYQKWLNVASAPYQSGTHGGRYVNNYADAHGDYRYKKFEKAGTMPFGSVLAKDSFVVRPDGKVALGPLFIMQKMGAGFNKASGDWRYMMVMPNGALAGMTKGKGMSMKFCAECHASVAPDQDHIMLLPEENRK